MGLVTSITERVSPPGEPDGTTITIRALGLGGLKRARDARSLEVAAQARAMGGEVMAAIQGAQVDPEVQRKRADPLNDYDVPTLLREAVVEWSYGEIDIDALDAETAEWTAREVLRLSRVIRSDADGAARKNAF